jgi:starch synthase (maltosyl-transferring)
LSLGSVCVSQGVLEFSRKVAGLKAQRLIVIPNGIDASLFDDTSAVRRTQLGIPEDAHLALFIGRLDPQKGIRDLLKAAEIVIPQCPAWHLVLAGDGPERAWLLKQTATRSLLAGRVHWLGVRGDIPRLLRSADVLVLPSLWEGMPNVILEAMAARRPVVATGVAGTNELVCHRETGWLVPPSNPDELGAALVDAALNPQRCVTLGLQAYKRVLSRFSLNRTVLAYDELWTRLLGYRFP